MCRFVRSLLLATTTLTAVPAMAAPTLLAIGTLSGATDLAPSTGTLENGLNGNILGGMGSALAWAGGYTFLAAPDCGPNATAYNAAVDDTTSYIPRFQTVTMALTPNGGAGLPYNLTPTLAATTLLSSPTALSYGTGAGLGNKIDGTTPIGSGAPALNTANQFFFSGRSDNFAAGVFTNPNNARFDPEGMRVSVDGKSVPDYPSSSAAQSPAQPMNEWRFDGESGWPATRSNSKRGSVSPLSSAITALRSNAVPR